MDYIYLICAVVGGTFLIMQFVFSMIGLGGEELGEDVGDIGDGDADLADGWLVGMLSLRALIGAITFFGLGGLAGQAANFEPTPTFLIAFACGAAALYLVATMVRWMRGLQSEGTIRIDRAVGKPGTVYVPIPPNNGGQGKVTVTLQNRTAEYAAMTPHDRQLATGETVIVTAVVNPDTLEVMPEGHQVPESPNG